MTAIARHRLDHAAVDLDFWPALAAGASQWLAGQGVAARDALVLLPHAGLLAPVRAAFARLGGWQPRVETPATLAEALGPPGVPSAGALTGDRVIDRLTGASLLQHQRPFAAWREREPRLFDESVAALVDAALLMHRAAHDRPPEDRAAWWAALREALPPVGGPGAAERQLARIALEWVALADPPATERLWSLRAAAWVTIQVAGEDPLAAALLAQAASGGYPALCLTVDPPGDTPLAAVALAQAPTIERADDLEDEAGAAALAVLDAVDQGRAPVALVAEDRLVVRRTRALLERAGVSLADETGWTLSTTRAAARLMAWLRAAEPSAGRDALVAAMKAASADTRAAASALEDAWRREREPAAGALRAEQAFRDRQAAWRGAGLHRLVDWLGALRAAATELLALLDTDPAGRQVLLALRLDEARPADAAWLSAAGSTMLDLAGFMAWVDATLEGTSFLPPAVAAAQVVITPLSRAAARPFGAVVFPGCDERHLGGAAPGPTLVPEPVAQAFGIAGAQVRRQRELLALALLLRVPRLHLIRRANDRGEPLAPSPWLELAWQARRRAGQALPVEQRVVMPRTEVQRTPLGRPAPAFAADLPTRVSASTVEALRDCPYRFFTRTALGLGEVAELDAELDKRDQGSWMHTLLHRFHQQRTGRDDRTELHAAADAAQAELGLDGAALLPFRAGFAAFAERYLDWLHERDRQGWRYDAGELKRSCAPPELGGVVLEGRLDRIDLGADGGAMVIDYKTGNAQKLAQRVRQPLEDTQLAFYAALLTEEPHEPPPRAIYLALHDREPPKAIEHRDVALSAAQLVDGLATDLAALRAGAGAPALGEGEACEHCAARGLCRRDQWSADA